MRTLEDPKHYLAVNFSQTEIYIRSILDSKNLEDNEINIIKFLTEQTHLSSKQNYGQHNVATMIEEQNRFICESFYQPLADYH